MMATEQRNELNKKLEQYSSFLASDPGNARLIQQCADVQLQLGDWQAARGFIYQGLESNPGHHGLLYLLSTIEIAAGQSQIAIDLLQSLIRNGVDNGQVRYNLAYALALDGRMEEARAALSENYDAIYADYPASGILLARIYHHLANMEQAISCLGRFLKDHPSHAEANGCLALAYTDLEDYRQAREVAEKSLLLGDNQEGRLAMGLVELEDSEADAALLHFQQASSMKQNSGRAWIGIGLANMLKGKLAEAEEALIKGLEMMPAHLGSWNALAWAQIAMNKLHEAERTLQRALDINRNFSETHGALAVVQFLKGDHESARTSVRRAKGLDGNSFAAAYAESLLLAQQGDREQAGSTMNELFKRSIGKDGKTLEGEIRKYAMKRQNESRLM